MKIFICHENNLLWWFFINKLLLHSDSVNLIVHFNVNLVLNQGCWRNQFRSYSKMSWRSNLQKMWFQWQKRWRWNLIILSTDYRFMLIYWKIIHFWDGFVIITMLRICQFIGFWVVSTLPQARIELWNLLTAFKSCRALFNFHEIVLRG